MISLVKRVGKHGLAAFVLALAIGIFSGSSAMAQHGGHGGGGGFSGMGHATGFGHHNFAVTGGYGFYPWYGTVYGGYDPGFAGYGYGYGYGDPYYGGYASGNGYPGYNYGGYGFASEFSDFGFVAPSLGY